MSKKKILLWAALAVFLLLIVLFFLFLARYGPNFGVYLGKPSPEKYGRQAVALMDNGYYADTEAWQALRQETLDALEDTQTFEDTYPLLTRAVAAAGGKHSRFLPPGASDSAQAVPNMPQVSESDGILTIRLPEFSGDEDSSLEYAQTGISWLHEHPDAIGVILDLRGNAGGDIAPMIGAVSPLLRDGDILYSRYRSGSDHKMTLRDGVFNGGSGIAVDILRSFPSVPVAILTDGMTASSGEGVVLAFRGMENTRVFGAPTAGFTSVNMSYPLYDGAELRLTVGALVAAKTGEVFCDEPIEPDVTTDNPEAEAAAWIRGVG